jgi:hypothetical protein
VVVTCLLYLEQSIDVRIYQKNKNSNISSTGSVSLRKQIYFLIVDVLEIKKLLDNLMANYVQFIKLNVLAL